MLIFVVKIRPTRTFCKSTHCLLSPFTLDWSWSVLVLHNPMWNMAVNNISYPIYPLSMRTEKGYITRIIPFFLYSVYYHRHFFFGMMSMHLYTSDEYHSWFHLYGNSRCARSASKATKYKMKNILLTVGLKPTTVRFEVWTSSSLMKAVLLKLPSYIHALPISMYTLV